MISEKIVFHAVESERAGERFPLDFDEVWQEGGYSRRDNALRAMVNSRLRINFDYLKIEGNKVKRVSDKYYLSSDAFKSYLLSANTDKGEETRRYFIEVEKRHRQNLERLLTSVEARVVEEVKFSFSSTQVQEWVGYCNLFYLREVIRTDYQANVDYIEIEKELYVNADTAQMILNFARPKHGVTIPPELKAHPFPWDKLQVYKDRKINRRRSCSKTTTSPGQLELF